MHDREFAQHLENLKVFVEEGSEKCSPVVAMYSIKKLAATRDMQSVEKIMEVAARRYA